MEGSQNGGSESRYRESFCHILKAIQTALENEDSHQIKKLVTEILAAKRIFVYGVGRSGLVGKGFAMRLVQMGLEAYFIGETITPIVRENDVVVLVSNTGSTMSAIQTGNIARRQGATVIAITSQPASKMAHVGSIVINIKPPCDKSKLELAPLGTLFEDATMIFLDGLVSVLMNERKETDVSMRKRHAIWV